MNNTFSLRRSISRLLFVLFCLFLLPRSYAQIYPDGPLTPGGALDTVFDMYGNRYPLIDLTINAPGRGSGAPGAPLGLVPMVCNSGYFEAFLEDGCGMELNNPIHQARRDVFCAVLSDLSQFINAPALVASGQRVRIWVRDMSLIPGITGNPLGVATSFYSVPFNNAVSGIPDNTVWITMHTGQDAYTNVASPLYAQANSTPFVNGLFFHALTAFNFAGGINWNTNLGNTTMAVNEHDLYTVMLHEMMHALGFSSLITGNGSSALGNGHPYYSRYDTHLQTQGGINLISNTGLPCTSYNYSFTGPVASLAPGGACPGNLTVCGTALRYNGSVVEPIYTPGCFEPGSSLSHFEDMCPVTANNDQIFVMSNAVPIHFAKRFPQPSERQVLCDIGYNVNTTYGDVLHSNVFNYVGAVCPGINVAGINDGIDQFGNYTYVSTGPAVSINNVLANDNNAVSIECVQPVIGTGVVTMTSSTAFNYTPSATPAVQLLRYIPVSATGQRGNITYVYVYANSANCPANACNMVANGGFESSVGGGMLGQPGITLDCWDGLLATPDLFNPGAPGIYNVPSNLNIPPLLSHDGLPNQSYIGLYSKLGVNGPGFGEEVIQGHLLSSLQPGQQYVLRFWAKVANYNPVIGFTNTPFIDYSIQFGATNAALAPISAFYNALPNYVTLVAPFTVPPVVTNSNSNGWTCYNHTFTYGGTTAGNFLYITGAPYLNPTTIPLYQQYIFLDDISIEPLAGSCLFTLPVTTVNTCTTVPNLVNLNNCVTVPGGVFTGPGVSVSGGIYSFTPIVAGLGVHTITYTYTDANGCVKEISAQIEVTSGNTAINVTANPSSVCPGQTVTLTASGGTSYSWTPGITCTPPCATGTATPSVTTTYVVTDIGSSCQGVATVTVGQFIATITPAGPTALCTGGSVVLNATTGTGYTYQWYLNGVAISGATSNSYTAATAGVYTVDINNGYCTTTSSPVTVTITAPPSISILEGAAISICPGTSTTLHAIPGSGLTYQWYYYSSIITGATSSTFNVSTPGVYSVHAYSSTNPCMASASITVTLIPAFVNITPFNPTIATCQSVTLTATGSTTYTWVPATGLSCTNCASPVASPTSTTTYTVTGVLNGCTSQNTSTVTVVAPPVGCTVCSTFGGNFNVLSGTTALTSLTGNWYISGNVTFTAANVNLSGAKLAIAPGVTINVSPGTNLDISSSHLFSCTSMWKGIVLQSNGGSTGRVRVLGSSLIEDALIAIDATNPVAPTGSTYLIYCDDAVFNSNVTAVSISGYQPNSYLTTNEYPFHFQNTVFTSRKFTGYSSGGQSYPMVWPSPASLKTSTGVTIVNAFTQPYYIKHFYGLQNCKNGSPATNGILLNTVGYTSGTTTFKDITIGDQFTTVANNRNLFDNLDCGINGTDANVVSCFNSFINIRRMGAIRVQNNSSLVTNRRLEVRPGVTTTGTNNIFYDCESNVFANNYYNVKAIFSKMISIHASNNTIGMIGHTLQVWKYGTITISGNDITNINAPVTIGVSGYLSGTQYQPGMIYVNDNKIQTHPSGYASITSQYIAQAIAIRVYGTCSNCVSVAANVDRNEIYDPYNGILVTNFGNQQVTSSNNIIRVRQATGSTGLQAGIDHQNCGNNVIRNNTLNNTGGSVTNYNRRAITTLNCPNQKILCNTITGYGKAFEFFGASPGTKWMKNVMSVCGRGFVINGAGTAIGSQGTLALSYDNKWNGTWTGTNYHTFSENSAPPNNSRLYCQNIAGSMPTNNSSNPLGFVYTLNINGLFVGNTASTYNCSSSVLPLVMPFTTPQFVDIVTNNVSYGCDAVRLTWVSQFNVWQALRSDTTWEDSSTVIDDWADSVVMTRLKYVTDMGDDLANANFAGLRNKIDNPPSPHRTINASNGATVQDDPAATSIVDNYREFYDLYLRHMGDSLDTTDTVRILVLAKLCPQTNGMAVILARALYDQVKGSNYPFNDAVCGCGVNSTRRAQPGEEPIVSPFEELQGIGAQKYTLSPNPSSGDINLLQMVKDDEPVKIQISSASGQLIYRNAVHFDEGRAHLKLEGLASGVYVMQLIDSTGNVYFIKFTIVL